MIIFRFFLCLFVITHSVGLYPNDLKTGSLELAKPYFSPEDRLDNQLIKLINEEQDLIYICVYLFTHRGIAKALIEARKRGVTVEVVVDEASIKTASLLCRLDQASIPVYIWEPDSSYHRKSNAPIMHHKFCVFGSGKVWLGSFNFTYQAARKNQEDAVVIEEAAVATAYAERFNMIKTRSGTPLASYLSLHPQQKRKKG